MIPHLQTPKNRLRLKIRTLINVDDNLKKNLPPELDKVERVHKNILKLQIHEIIKEMTN